jgi:hypothetical protein
MNAHQRSKQPGSLRGHTLSNQAPHDAAEHSMFADLDHAPEPPAPGDEDRDFWVRSLRSALAQRSSRSLAIAEQGLKVCPVDPELLLLAALTATAAGKPDRSLALLKRYGKRYVATKPVTLLTALALGDQERHAEALTLLRAEKLDTDRAALDRFVGEDVMAEWLFDRLRTIRLLGSLATRKARAKGRPKPPALKPGAVKAGSRKIGTNEVDPILWTGIRVS